MRYLMLIKHGDDLHGTPIPKALGGAMGEFIGKLTTQGKFIEGEGLQPSAKGKRVDVREGKLTVIDGPFTEAKELIGGYMVIEAESDEEALAITSNFMELHRVNWPEFHGQCELRGLQR